MNIKDTNLQLDQIKFFNEFPLQQGQKDIFQEIIEWHTEPPLVKTGRSTFLMIGDENLPFKGIKIKGCGYFDLHTKKVSKPSDKEGYDAHIQNAPDGIKEIHYQIEVNEKDELEYSIPKKRPFGAQIYEKAKLEYDANKTLYKNWTDDKKDFPFYLPIGYGRFKDLKYKDEPLGVTILGMPQPTETPLAAYFEGRFEGKGLRINPFILEYWKNHLSVAGQNEPDYFDLITTLKKLCFNFGQSLSHFHDHFVDFDAHFFNSTVDNDRGTVLLYDFDHVLSVKDITDQKYFYYALKDFEIGLVAILSNFMLSGLIDGITLFEKQQKPLDDYNIIKSYFEGYFGNLSKEAVDLTQSIWERLFLFTGNKLFHIPQAQHIHFVHQFCEQEREKSYLDIYPFLLEKIKNKRKSFILPEREHQNIVESLLKQRRDLEKIKM